MNPRGAAASPVSPPAGARPGLLGGAVNPVAQGQPASEGLSPEEIAKLKKAKQIAMTMIFDEKVFGEVVKRYDAGDKVQVLANTLVIILSKTEEAVGGMSVASLLALGIALVGEVAEVLNDTGREYTAQDVEQALYLGVQLWLKQNEGRVDPQELQAGVQSMQQIVGRGEQAQPTQPAMAGG